MKTSLSRLALVCLLNAFVFSVLHAQTCTFVNLRLTSQASVNAFSSACTTINGDITVSGADITDLSPLQHIQTINGKLTIQNNPALTSLNGLKNLTGTQHLLIYTNDLLTSLAGLEKLNTVSGSLHIRYNKNLVNLKGLDGLTGANQFYITNNDLLANLSGLGSLATVSDLLSISSNKSLVNFSGLSSLTSVSRINIGENDALTDFSGLESLTSVTWQMNVSSNKSLTSFNGLTNLNYLSEAYLSANNAMTDLSGLENVRSVYWLVVGESSGLTSLNGLHNLVSATNFIIRGNALLTDLAGLDNLATAGWLQISDNPELQSLSHLGTASSTGRVAALTIGGLVIRDNARLTSCAVAAVCDFTSANEATISGNGPGCQSQAAVEASCAALPVTLAHFKAKAERGTAVLQWATAEEKNSDFFEIEHSFDAKVWHRVGGQQAKGESHAVVNYEWTHTAPVNGINYYRLKMADLDGTFTYSHIEPLKFENLVRAVVYPNPVADILFVQNSKDAMLLRIIDATGKKVYETSRVPQMLPVRDLGSGTYQVQVTRHGGVVEQQRIVVF
ncbi:hypothetical protein GCM10010967_43720 [Dyadobacter beijingensis]|uniref:Secreted protein (Por secretion system target) n=1 Tax=Dyadobacter beijingensis TaxID=365489 RepID=A0ABQ2I905_9BACT|nr:T9SS type A sorting domain-containing protein [Dyadobacter beijingensis]GGN04089.1 hypothetical protein GCM10010967_43720 [Dyadobacter beijingensis]